MSVGRICTRVVHTAAPDETVRHAAGLMRQHNVGTLVVLDPGGRPIGLVTDRDIAVRLVGHRLNADETTISMIMTGPVSTVKEETPIESALEHMAGAKIRRLVVVDRNDQLVGLLALDDVLGLLVEETESIGRILRGQVWV